jgi:O-acetyl-ADP-ribose deacetylase (regulator of RNase III)
VRAGLVDLVAQIRSLEIESVAMPALGCGLGQLAWDEVKPLIHEALGGLNGVRVLLFEPSL